MGGDIELHALVYWSLLANSCLISENPAMIAPYMYNPIHLLIPYTSVYTPVHPLIHILVPLHTLCALLLAHIDAANATFYYWGYYTSVHNTALAPGFPIDQT